MMIPESDIHAVIEGAVPPELRMQTGDEVPRFLIPECCREGWETCPHVINKPQEPERRNPAV